MSLFYLLAFFLSCFLTYLIRQYALKKSLLDLPNARSSHSQPTPRGGGLAIVLTFFLTLLLLQFTGLIELQNRSAIAILLSSFVIAGIGFCDDHQHIPARWRLLVHLIATASALIFLPHLPTLPLFGFELDFGYLGVLFYTLAIVWLLNLYNFMDGIDGIASTEFISVTLNATLLVWLENQIDWLAPLWLIAAATAGFLVWNWASAKIFMGDVGSGFLGFFLGIFVIFTASNSALNLWSWLILLAVFISDASFTLLKRFLTKQVWYEAHCSHTYQRYAKQVIAQLSQQGLTPQTARCQAHRRINFIVLFINSGWLLPLAALAMHYPDAGLLISVIAIAPLLFLAQHFKAGQPE